MTFMPILLSIYGPGQCRNDNVKELAILLMCTHFRVEKYQSAMKMLRKKAAHIIDLRTRFSSAYTFIYHNTKKATRAY